MRATRIYVVSSIWADGRTTPFIATHTLAEAERYLAESGWTADKPGPADHRGYDVLGINLLPLAAETT